MSGAILTTKNKQLLVEGRTPQRFFQALVAHLALPVEVQNFGGNTELRAFLKGFRRSPGFEGRVESIGVVRDAETNPDGAFISVRDALRDAELPVPHVPIRPSEGTPQTSILILPDQNTTGMLETLCWAAVEDDPAALCVDRYLDCLQDRMPEMPGNPEKARIQAFLASRQKAGLLVGEAADKGYWPWDAPAFDQIRAFLQDL